MIINTDNVDPKNLSPNKNDPFGWIDNTTQKNYWIIDSDGDVQISPLIIEEAAEIRPMPIKKTTRKI